MKKAKAYMVWQMPIWTPARNWDVQTNIKECCMEHDQPGTRFAEKYPNHVFNFEGGVNMPWIKGEYYPGKYEEMKSISGKCRWHIPEVAGMQTDALGTFDRSSAILC